MFKLDKDMESRIDKIIRIGEKFVEQSPSPVKAESTVPKLTVENIDNHVYFYADVDSDRCLALIRSIREIDNRLRNENISRSLGKMSFPPTPIILHINSGGGDLFSGLATADQLASIQSPIYSIAEGLCASAATLLSLSCTKRFILPSTYMLIHQFSSWFIAGTYEKFKDEMKLQDKLIETLRNFYVEKTKMSRDVVIEHLKHDSWFDANKCVKLGLADEVI